VWIKPYLPSPHSLRWRGGKFCHVPLIVMVAHIFLSNKQVQGFFRLCSGRTSCSTVISNKLTKFLLLKSTDALISQIYFCQETIHVSGSSSAHHQEFSTVHSALVYVLQVWWQLSSTTRMFHPGRGFLITHNDAPQSVGHLWTSDQSVAETSTWQNTTLTTDKHPCPG